MAAAGIHHVGALVKAIGADGGEERRVGHLADHIAAGQIFGQLVAAEDEGLLLGDLQNHQHTGHGTITHPFYGVSGCHTAPPMPSVVLMPTPEKAANCSSRSATAA